MHHLHFIKGQTGIVLFAPISIKTCSKEKGFNEVNLYAGKKGYIIYEAYDRTEGRPPCVGYPCFILAFNETIRMATEEETRNIIGV